MYRTLQRWGVRLLGLLLAGSLLGAYCGRKDDLYLPREKPTATAEQGTAPAPPASPVPLPAPAPAAEPSSAPPTKVN